MLRVFSVCIVVVGVAAVGVAVPPLDASTQAIGEAFDKVIDHRSHLMKDRAERERQEMQTQLHAALRKTSRYLYNEPNGYRTFLNSMNPEEATAWVHLIVGRAWQRPDISSPARVEAAKEQLIYSLTFHPPHTFDEVLARLQEVHDDEIAQDREMMHLRRSWALLHFREPGFKLANAMKGKGLDGRPLSGPELAKAHQEVEKRHLEMLHHSHAAKDTAVEGQTTGGAAHDLHKGSGSSEASASLFEDSQSTHSSWEKPLSETTPSERSHSARSRAERSQSEKSDSEKSHSVKSHSEKSHSKKSEPDGPPEGFVRRTGSLDSFLGRSIRHDRPPTPETNVPTTRDARFEEPQQDPAQDSFSFKAPSRSSAAGSAELAYSHHSLETRPVVDYDFGESMPPWESHPILNNGPGGSTRPHESSQKVWDHSMYPLHFASDSGSHKSEAENWAEAVKSSPPHLREWVGSAYTGDRGRSVRHSPRNIDPFEFELPIQRTGPDAHNSIATAIEQYGDFTESSSSLKTPAGRQTGKSSKTPDPALRPVTRTDTSSSDLAKYVQGLSSAPAASGAVNPQAWPAYLHAVNGPGTSRSPRPPFEWPPGNRYGSWEDPWRKDYDQSQNRRKS